MNVTSTPSSNTHKVSSNLIGDARLTMGLDNFENELSFSEAKLSNHSARDDFDQKNKNYSEKVEQNRQKDREQKEAAASNASQLFIEKKIKSEPLQKRDQGSALESNRLNEKTKGRANKEEQRLSFNRDKNNGGPVERAHLSRREVSVSTLPSAENEEHRVASTGQEINVGEKGGKLIPEGSMQKQGVMQKNTPMFVTENGEPLLQGTNRVQESSAHLEPILNGSPEQSVDAGRMPQQEQVLMGTPSGIASITNIGQMVSVPAVEGDVLQTSVNSQMGFEIDKTDAQGILGLQSAVENERIHTAETLLGTYSEQDPSVWNGTPENQRVKSQLPYAEKMDEILSKGGSTGKENLNKASLILAQARRASSIPSLNNDPNISMMKGGVQNQVLPSNGGEFLKDPAAMGEMISLKESLGGSTQEFSLKQQGQTFPEGQQELAAALKTSSQDSLGQVKSGMFMGGSNPGLNGEVELSPGDIGTAGITQDINQNTSDKLQAQIGNFKSHLSNQTIDVESDKKSNLNGDLLKEISGAGKLKKASADVTALSGVTVGASKSEGVLSSQKNTAPQQPINIKDVAGKVKMLFSKDNSEITMKLTPEHLGKLEIKLKKDGDLMTAQLKVESVAAKELLDKQLPQLQKILEEQNIPVKDFNVLVNQEDTSQSEFAFNKGKDSGSNRGSGTNDASIEESAQPEQDHLALGKNSSKNGMNIYA